MWFLQNQTAYGAERSWIRDKHGVHHYLVAVHASFDVDRQGTLTLSDEQPPPLLMPEYRGDPSKTSLRRDSDLLFRKSGTDVVLDSCAYAPGSEGRQESRAVPSVPVRIRVGPIDKSLWVHGERQYRRGIFGGRSLSAPQPFCKRPIQYEWAYGGTDAEDPDPRRQQLDVRNPVGKGIAVNPPRQGPWLAHSIEYPQADAVAAGPAGFGPIAPHWSPRRERAGTFDVDWEKTKKPLLPDDFDERYGHCAPDDQHCERPLRGGESVALENLTPEGTLAFQLPKIFFAFQTRLSGRVEEHRATLSTLFIDTEARKISLIWQSSLRVKYGDVEHLDFTRIVEKSYVR